MNAFKGCRVIREYTQTNPASPAKVFPLLCPVREADWLPGWEYRVIYSDSGVAELGCVFTTPSSATDEAPELTWVVTEHDPAAFRVSFLWLDPGRVVTEIRIQLTPGEDETTRAHIRYRYTGLSEAGNCELEGYDQKWFEAKMQRWETAINHYLRTGQQMAAAAH